MRIALVVYCLRGGGAERVASYLANDLAHRGHAVTVITELPPCTDQHVLAAGVARAVIGSEPGRSALDRAWRTARKILTLRGALRQANPDVVASFMTRSNNLTLLATLGTGIRTVISERNDPRYNRERAGDAGLRRRLYRRADLLVAQTETVAGVVRELFGATRTAIIPNPSVVDADGSGDHGLARSRDYVLAMGRLAPQKGFDVLIRAYASSAARESLDLVIAGQGGRRAEWEALAVSLGVADRVQFVGHVEQPFPLIRGCRMFVLSSLWEGFPNVLLEAMSFGRPVISTILPSGAHDMIVDGVNGLLIPSRDGVALATAIDRLAGDRDAAEAMGARGPAAVARFRLPVVMDQWEAALTGVVRGTAP